MTRLYSVLLFSFLIILPVFNVKAQFIEKAGKLWEAGFGASDADTVRSTSVSVQDSMKMREMDLRMQELKLQEMRLRKELEADGKPTIDIDSIRLAAMRIHIDSLRSLTPGVPVVIKGDTLFRLFADRGGYSAEARAHMIVEKIDRIVHDRNLRSDSIHTLDNDGYIDIMYGPEVIMSITDKDAIWQNTTRQALAQRYGSVFAAKITDLSKKDSVIENIVRILLFILIIVAQYFLWKLTNYLFRKLRRLLIRFKQQRLRPVVFRDYELLNKRQLGKILIFLSNIVRYLVLLLELTFTVPLLFAIFPQTENLALRILAYIIGPIKMVGISIVEYIPNLFIIVVIWICIRYLIKGLRYITGEIENGKLKINGFYIDWAQPTFNIIRFLLYAFMIAMIYPYLPGAESGVFQGISVFVGLIVSLGSSTVIGNIIAGFVITYMRPFKLGDRIKMNDTTGNVIEKTPFVTRIRTPKNEIVTIPNSFMMSSHIVNYSSSARQFGLIIHTTVTIGYDAPWRMVHQLLINAARSTEGVVAHPKPFVLETGLDDYYPCYQINAYIKDADKLPQIMSNLHQNIQDTFTEAGVEIMSPHYVATRDGNESTIPPAEEPPR